jgi:DNA-binding PucR family transcriptional regulator
MSDLQQKLLAIRHVASQISVEANVEALLPELIRAACEAGGWDRGTVMSIDLEHGYAQVVTRHEKSMLPQQLEDRWQLATSPSLVALKQGDPVYIRDALEATQFPGYRREAQEHGYRTVLVFPMSSVDVQGRPMVLTVASRTVREVSDDDMTFMAAVVHLGAIAVERAHRHRSQVDANERLQSALEAQRTLLRRVLAGGSLESLTSDLGDLLGCPVMVVDFLSNSVVSSRSAAPMEFDDDGWTRMLAGARGREIASKVREAVQVYRKTSVALPVARDLPAAIEPLTVDNELVGALLTFGDDKASDLQLLMLESARFALSVHLMRSVIQFRFETRSLSELFFEIVERRWKSEEDVLARGGRMELSLASPLTMLVIDFPPGSEQSSHLAIECQGVADLVASQLRVQMHVVTVGSGLVCLVPREGPDDAISLPRLAQRLSEALSRPLGREPIVVVGEICEGLESLATDWERCWRMIRIARDFGRSGPLDMPALGPLPMLVGAADSADVRNFVDGTIGKLIEHDAQHPQSMYLETLAAYVRSGCRSQPCADSMGVHVTTLRYRLSRIQDLFGIDVEAPERRFAVELAIHLDTLTRRNTRRAKSGKTLPRKG